MSRSYRKTVFPYESHPKNKKFANRKVRRSNDLLQGGDYRKVYESWNIRCGYWIVFDENDYVQLSLPYTDKSEYELRRIYRMHMRTK
jgi:hypothetical protein